jgi:hypothetical protein
MELVMQFTLFGHDDFSDYEVDSYSFDTLQECIDKAEAMQEQDGHFYPLYVADANNAVVHEFN